MTLTLAAIADIHVGKPFYFRNQLSKMGDQALPLTKAFVHRMNGEIRPDLALCLGDLIQDESPESDRANYELCCRALDELRAPLRHVVGNHDTINLSDDVIREVWSHKGPLFYGFDFGGFHFSVLRTIEEPQVVVRVDREQLAWFRHDLEQTRLPVVVLMHHSASEQNLHGNRWFAEHPHIALVRERAEIRQVVKNSGNVRLVLNGHVHWNHVDIHDGIPYVTVQSLTENVYPDAPGLPAAAWAILQLEERGLSINVEGVNPMRFQHHG